MLLTRTAKTPRFDHGNPHIARRRFSEEQKPNHLHDIGLSQVGRKCSLAI
jgi:hypothetical protein